MREPFLPPPPEPEVEREMLSGLTIRGSQAVVLTGVRRCGKSTLQTQLMQRVQRPFYCDFEDTRLFGFGPDDFSTFLSVLDELTSPDHPVFLDEVQEVEEWQRLLRALLDRGRAVCVTGSNASPLGRELGAKLTGRHLSFEVFPFSYPEYLVFTGKDRGADSFRAYLDEGGFPPFSPTWTCVDKLLSIKGFWVNQRRTQPDQKTPKHRRRVTKQGDTTSASPKVCDTRPDRPITLESVGQRQSSGW